jgi:hypothetical protein
MPDDHAARRRFRETFWFKLLVSALIVAALAAVLSHLDFRRDLSFLDVKILSGAQEGHYHVVAQEMSDYAQREHGRIANLTSDGTVDNLHQLTSARKGCGIQFGLAQDGADFPSDPPIQLVGRLPHAETVFLLGKSADDLHDFAQLRGLKVGVGPADSGTSRVAHQLFDSPDFRGLGMALQNHPLTEQIDLAARGELDLAMFVMDEDAPVIQSAIREKGLQMVGFPHVQVLARQAAHLRTGTVVAGQFDPVRTLPPADKGVLQVETLVVANGCASRSQTIGLMEALSEVYPDFIRHNRETANTTGLHLNAAAKSYFDNGGPEIFDEYAPWLVDIMPPGNWVYIVTGVSILFNIMGFGHRYQLWQIDSRRVKLEQELSRFFGPGATMGDIERMEVTAAMRQPEVMSGIRDLVLRLEALAARSRKASLSVLVPMGQEMAYRYQENLIHQTLSALRAFLWRSNQPQTTPAARAS